jgi:hypothetical protein
MTYEVIGLRPTYGLPSLVLSPLTIYTAHNTMKMPRLRLQRPGVGATHED